MKYNNILISEKILLKLISLVEDIDNEKDQKVKDALFIVLKSYLSSIEYSLENNLPLDE